MNGILRHGVNAAVAAINHGDFAPFWNLIADVNGQSPNQRAAGLMALRGTLICFSDFAIAAKTHQVRYGKAQPPTREEIDYALAIGGARLSATTQLLLNLVAGVRQASPRLRVSIPGTMASHPRPRRFKSR